MIDNIDLILPFINPESDDDYYYLQLIKRKKENPELGANSRIIKNYYIKSKDDLLKKYEEIKSICIATNSRASIRLNKRSFRISALKSMENIANSMISNNNKVYNCFDHSAGIHHNDHNKKWILDFDFFIDDKDIESYKSFINSIEPVGNKILAKIPSKNGFHLITKPFNSQIFKRDFPKIEIHKDNPTNLFVP